MAASSDPLAPYSPIRAVGVPHAPFDGILARDPDGAVVLLVDRRELDSWTGWNAPRGEHILTPRDVSRRAEGHDVVLPAVAERLDRFLGRRAAHAPLTPGECVTLGVSILRGLADLLAHPVDAAQWWLTDDGRPVIVPGVGESDPRRASAEMLAHAASAEHPAGRMLRELATSVAAVRRPAQLAADEDALFALAGAEPLATDVLAPVRQVVPSAPHHAPVVDEGRAPWWAGLAARFDGELADTVSRLLPRLRRRAAQERPRRRLPLLVAVCAAVVVLGAGLLWPDGGDADADAHAAPDASVSVDASSRPVAEQPAEPSTAQEQADAPPEEVLGVLLSRLRTCADDACRAEVWEDPARAREHGALSQTDPTIALVDDLGGLMVLRVEPGDAASGAQLVTIVDTPHGWRVRDVFDIADPPSSG